MSMVVKLKPETESLLHELAATTGRAPDELNEDAMNGYLAELAQVRVMIDQRYDQIKNGSVIPLEMVMKPLRSCERRIRTAKRYERLCPSPRGGYGLE
jgi:predicted transcriptional regulator